MPHLRTPSILSLMYAVVGLAGCVVTVPTVDELPAQPSPPFPLEQTLAVEAALDDALVAVPAWGCEVGLANASGSWARAGGTEGPDGEPLITGTAFGLASISKAYVAAMVLRIVEDTELGLDDTLEQHLPGVHPRGADITLEMLLNQTAGVPEFFSTPEFGADPERAWTDEELFGFVADDPLVNEPGAAYGYSNTHYTLAAAVAQASQGQPWRELMSEWILGPLELSWTRVPALGDGWGDITQPYVGEQAVSVWVHPQAVGAAGNLVADGRDVARFAYARFSGELLDATHERQFDSVPLPGSNASYGLGLLALGDEVGHNGALNGFATWTSYRDDLDVAMAVLCNAWGADPLDMQYPSALAQTLWEELE